MSRLRTSLPKATKWPSGRAGGGRTARNSEGSRPRAGWWGLPGWGAGAGGTGWCGRAGPRGTPWGRCAKPPRTLEHRFGRREERPGKAVQDALRFALSNFTLTFLVLGLMASGIALLRAPKPLTRPVVIEALLSYFVLFSVGVSFFYNFLAHTFFGA